jgi:hypothetical protein
MGSGEGGGEGRDPQKKNWRVKVRAREGRTSGELKPRGKRIQISEEGQLSCEYSVTRDMIRADTKSVTSQIERQYILYTYCTHTIHATLQSNSNPYRGSLPE